MSINEKAIWFICCFAALLLVSLVVIFTPSRPNPVAKSEPITARSTPPPTAWDHQTTIDEMSGKSYALSTVQSWNTVSFGFPYQGEQRATLHIRTKHPRYGNDVILTIQRGQFLAGVDGIKVLARFDEGQPVAFWGSGPADHSSTTLFISNYQKFVGLMRKASVVRLSTPIYHEGSPVFEFQVEAFDKQPR
jgi:hypothetical protein